MAETSSEEMRGTASDWMKVRDCARELGIPLSRCYDLIARGDLPAVRLGERSLRVHRGQLERFLLEERPVTGERAHASE